MTGIERYLEWLEENCCPYDKGFETEMSQKCKEMHEGMTNVEIYKTGDCAKCWCSDFVREVRFE